MLREWTERDCQKLWSTGNLKDGKNKVVPAEPVKMGYIELWAEEIQNRRMEQSKGMKCGKGEASSDVVKLRYIFFYCFLYIYTNSKHGNYFRYFLASLIITYV